LAYAILVSRTFVLIADIRIHCGSADYKVADREFLIGFLHFHNSPLDPDSGPKLFAYFWILIPADPNTNPAERNVEVYIGLRSAICSSATFFSLHLRNRLWMCGYAVVKQHFFKKFQTAEKIMIEDMQLQSIFFSLKCANMQLRKSSLQIANEGIEKVAHAHLC
jgi:hypothetical protein